MTDTNMSKKTVPQKMAEILKEASSLRYGAQSPPPGSDIHTLLEALQDYRTRLDRIEYLLTSAVLERGKAYRANKDAQDAAADKWDESITRMNDRKAASLVAANNFEAPREKYASANLASFDQRRAARITEEEFSWTDTSVDALNKMYRGLDSARQDLLTRIKSIPLVNGLEYTTS